MDAFLTEIRLGARSLLREPGLSILAIVALALGIGFTTLMFAIVNGILLRGLPYEGADRIMHLERKNVEEGIEGMGVTVHDFVDWREQQRSFEDLAAFYEGTVNVSGTERPIRFDGAFITPSAFAMLGVRPVVGRAFREGEWGGGTEPVILLGHHVWRDHFESDPEIVGRTVRMNGRQATVIGVMPEGFRFPILQDVWVPLPLDPVELQRGEGTTLEVFGRLKEGVSPDRASVEMNAVAKRLALEYPETNEGVGVEVKPFTAEFVGEDAVRLLWTMLAAVFLVLLVACVNVANLLLARASARTKETAIRAALGAGRIRVVAQHVAEALVLSAAGAVLALAIAWVGTRLFNAGIAVDDIPFWIDIGIDPAVVAFVGGVALFAALLAGTIPAFKASGTDVNGILKDESRGSTGLRIGRLSRVLVVGQIALAGGFLVGAGLMIKSVVNLGTVDYGVATEGVLTARVGLFEADYPDPASRVRFSRELEERLAGAPGVRSAAVTTDLPVQWAGSRSFAVEGESYDRDQDRPVAQHAVVTPRFFETFDVGILQGEGLTWRDDADARPVAVVNRAFARKFFSGGSALGRRIQFDAPDGEAPWRTIVGVVPDMHMGSINGEIQEGVYVPLAQADARFMSIAARGDGDPGTLAPVLRDAVSAVDPNLPIYWVKSMEDVIAEADWPVRLFGTLFMVFGAAALFLASIGLYGVMAFSVSARFHEVGIRMALGARAADVVRMVLRRGVAQVAVGLALALPLAILLARGLQDLLYEVDPSDPTIFAGIAAVLAATGIVATLVPARRAARVDPMVTLREE